MGGKECEELRRKIEQKNDIIAEIYTELEAKYVLHVMLKEMARRVSKICKKKQNKKHKIQVTGIS